MNRTIHAQSGHTLFVKSIEFEDLPDNIKNGGYAKDFKQFWRVKNWDDSGVTFMYLGKGMKNAPKQICVWYSRGNFWSGYGKTIEDAINGAQKEGWLYA